MEEHDQILRFLDLLERTRVELRNSGPATDGFKQWAVDFIVDYADRSHHSKEEDCLFPLLEQRGIPNQGGPIGMMLHEHNTGRQWVQRMRDAVGQSEAMDLEFADAAAKYIALLRQHIAKENEILYPMGMQAMNEEDDTHLLSQFNLASAKNAPGLPNESFIWELDEWEKKLNS
tara:strand:- start:1057 stop:1578 length:522 start_codon:yes stop_codon:yes gene_type:complete